MADNTETTQVDPPSSTAETAVTPPAATAQAADEHAETLQAEATEGRPAASPEPQTPQPTTSGPQTAQPVTGAPKAPRAEGPRASQPPRVEPAQPGRAQIFGVALLNAIERLAKWTVAELAKPKVRLVVVGAILIVVGVWIIDHSVWTFPLVIIGIVMIIVAWVGSRLEGRFAIEWNDGGAGFDMRARIKPRHPELPAAVVTSTHSAPGVSVQRTIEDADVIEGEAHTIEIDVEELRALVEAAERGTAATNGSNGSTGAGSGTSTANVTHVSFQGNSDGIDRGVSGAGG